MSCGFGCQIRVYYWKMEEVHDAAEDDWDEDEDEATQYMIEQSLLEYSKHTDSAARYR